MVHIKRNRKNAADCDAFDLDKGIEVYLRDLIGVEDNSFSGELEDVSG